MALTRQAEIDDMLAQTLDDRRLSRTEKRALREVFADLDPDDEERAFIRNRVFAIARESIRGVEAAEILGWAEEVIKVLHSRLTRDATIAEVHFSPGDECRLRITSLLRRCKQSADICVFTITDDRLAQAVLEAHRRGVAVRVISDNEKAFDPGSDVMRLARIGVEVCVDESEHHMHHKFATFDRGTVVTGSYNWTRSAAEHNRENVVVSDESKIVGPYQAKFDEMWNELVQGHRLTAS